MNRKQVRQFRIHDSLYQVLRQRAATNYTNLTAVVQELVLTGAKKVLAAPGQPKLLLLIDSTGGWKKQYGKAAALSVRVGRDLEPVESALTSLLELGSVSGHNLNVSDCLRILLQLGLLARA